MMIRRGGWFLAVAGAATLCLVACSGSGGSPASSAPASAVSPSASDSLAALEKVAAFALGIAPLQSDYRTTAQEYKAAVTSKDVATSITKAKRLRSICAEDARVAPSGDQAIDSEWSQFASDCQSGWTLIAEAFQKKDAALIKQAHAFFDTATAHELEANKLLLAQGQKALQ